MTVIVLLSAVIAANLLIIRAIRTITACDHVEREDFDAWELQLRVDR